MANVKVATPLTLSWAAECMLKANLCLCRPRRAETEGWGEPGAAGSSGQTFRCSPWDGPSRTCASEKPRQWFAPKRKKKKTNPKKRKNKWHFLLKTLPEGISGWRRVHHLLLFMGAEIQEHVQILKLPRRTFDDKLFQRRHAQIHPRLKHRSQLTGR